MSRSSKSSECGSTSSRSFPRVRLVSSGSATCECARARHRAAPLQLPRTDPPSRRPGRRHALRRRGGDGPARGRRRRCAAAAYGEQRPPARVIVLAPSGRLLDDAPGRRARRRAAHRAALRALRGNRRSRPPASRQRFGLDRPLRPGRGRAGGDGRRRRGPPQAARGAWARGQRRSRSRSPRRLTAPREYPHYTRPASYRGWEVPEVLRSRATMLAFANGGSNAAAAPNRRPLAHLGPAASSPLI